MERGDELFLDHLKSGTPFAELPAHLRAGSDISEAKWLAMIIDWNIKQSKPWQTQFSKQVTHNEYAHKLIEHLHKSYGIFPYCEASYIVGELGVTPYVFYREILIDMIQNNVAFDQLPNFTNRESVRILGVERTSYLNILNKYRSKIFFIRSRRNEIINLFPTPPKQEIESWYEINIGKVNSMNDEIVKKLTDPEKAIIRILFFSKQQLHQQNKKQSPPQTPKQLFNEEDLSPSLSKKASKRQLKRKKQEQNIPECLFGHCPAGLFEKETLHTLLQRVEQPLIYAVVPLSQQTRVSVVPLENFVMNRSSEGDAMESLLQRVLHRSDARHTLQQMAMNMQLSLIELKQAVSLLIQMGMLKISNISDAPTFTLDYCNYPLEYEQQIIL
ncbi:MAG: putative FAM91 family protein [Streblomastix strix]|uniref:Putative FAM91 family protein n=1 Tax=Streblomastix strix TaxID=222440 RepID=A0A5J4W7B8_9EUKA|nr:MAG: putative FAM91 family protein [Streblomastix strix]